MKREHTKTGRIREQLHLERGGSFPCRISVFFFLLLTGCTDQPADVEEADYYPMSVGDTWRYRETTDQYGEQFYFTRSVVAKSRLDLGWEKGLRDVFLVENKKEDDPPATTVYLTEDDGDRVTRHTTLLYDADGALIGRKDYVPDFFRFDRTMIEVGDTECVDAMRHTLSPSGEVLESRQLFLEYTIVEIGATVVVPAGVFEDCIVVERNEPFSSSDAELKRYYYAPGVGEVLELHVGEPGYVEELVEITKGDL